MKYKNIHFAVFCKNNLGNYIQKSVWFRTHEEALDYRKNKNKIVKFIQR